MTSERTLLVNGSVIKAGRRAKGFPTRAAFFRHLESRKLRISEDTLRRCEESPTKRHRSYLGTLEILAKELDLPVDDLVVNEGIEQVAPAASFRDCSGRWEVTGRDIVVEGHFEYPNGPKTFAAEITIVIDPESCSVSAQGRDHDEDQLTFTGRVRENGNQIVGQYEIDNKRLHVYGTVNAEYHSCGRRISGFYLGRDTGHGTSFILGSLDLKLLDP